MIRQLLRSLTSRRKAPLPPEQSPLVKEGAGKRLLIVDDEPNIVRLMVVYLHPHGYEIDTAANGQKALEKLRVPRPDLLITDQMMPVMNGMALTAAVRADKTLSSMPVIMLQARIPDDLSPKPSYGADHVLTKPFNPHVLHPLVMRVLKNTCAESLPKREDESGTGTVHRVLVVNNIPHITSIIEKFLEPPGYIVEAVTGTQEAYNTSYALYPDVLIIGTQVVETQNMDRDALLDAVRRSPLLRNMPVILLCARPSDYEPKLKEGADLYLDIPFNRRDLVEQIARLTA